MYFWVAPGLRLRKGFGWRQLAVRRAPQEEGLHLVQRIVQRRGQGRPLNPRIFGISGSGSCGNHTSGLTPTLQLGITIAKPLDEIECEQLHTANGFMAPQSSETWKTTSSSQWVKNQGMAGWAKSSNHNRHCGCFQNGPQMSSSAKCTTSQNSVPPIQSLHQGQHMHHLKTQQIG